MNGTTASTGTSQCTIARSTQRWRSSAVRSGRGVVAVTGSGGAGTSGSLPLSTGQCTSSEEGGPEDGPGVPPLALRITRVRGFRQEPPRRRLHGCPEDSMATYQLVYRDDDGENQVTETLENIDDVQREDGIVSIWRGNTAILRLQERHVVSLERV
jgi:hypothetical protein